MTFPRREPLRGPTTTSSSSATAASTARRGSTARRSSSRAQRPPTSSARARAAGVRPAFQACADRLQADGVDLAGYTLPQRVDDLEAARKALGYDRVDLLSESSGTRTAMIYALAPPEQHPPLGDDRRQPARPLPLDAGGDRRADATGTPRCARRTRTAAPGPATSSRDACAARRGHARTTGASSRSSAGNVRARARSSA